MNGNDKQALDRAICQLICRSDGIKAREIARRLGVDHTAVNRELYGSPLMRELCWQDGESRWHGIVRQSRPHAGLREFAGYYGLVRDFLPLSEAEWLAQLEEGCVNVGRSLSDTRGLYHSS